jgi:hypothetical protein
MTSGKPRQTVYCRKAVVGQGVLLSLFGIEYLLGCPDWTVPLENPDAEDLLPDPSLHRVGL